MKKIILLFIFSFLILSCYSSENDQSKIWGMYLSDIETDMQSQNYQFLESLDFKQLEKQGSIQEINRLSSGAAFYYSFIFEQLGQRENQLIFLRSEMLFGERRKEAAQQIYSILSDEKEWTQLSGLLELYVSENGRDPDILSLLLESLYKSEALEKVISFSGSDFSSPYSLFSLIRKQHSQWEKTLEEHLYNGADSAEIDEIYNLLMEQDLFYSINETNRLYLLAMSSYFHKDYGKSGEFFNKLNLDPALLNRYPVILYNLRKPLQLAGQAKPWAEYFSSIAKSLGKKSSFVSSFVSARLFLYKRDYVNADLMFRQAIESATTDYEEDRARWYLMNLYRSNLFHLTGMIEEFAPLWNDPEYFNDILGEYLSLVISRGEWTPFLRIYPSVFSHGDSEMKAAYSWIKYLAVKSRYVPEDETSQLISAMTGSHHLGFYNLMGNLLSGKNPVPEKQNIMETESVYSDIDELVLGFIEYHLEDEALEYVTGKEDQLNDEVLRMLSRIASQSGDNLRSIQLINYVSSRKGYQYTINDLKLMYPNEYENHIDFYSKEYGFSGEMLSGIIRTESAFTKDIVSFAGAVGLSQLMPDTEEEKAGKLNIETLDLTDPETNIHIGSSYIKWISDRPWTANMSQVLIAYNAGGGNLRKWKRIYPAYRDELFAELIPYKETRNYVKKVLTSSIIYGTLYKDLDPVDVVRKIYPDFNDLKSINN